jgi:hypothetical protein
MGFCECYSQRINEQGNCRGCARPVRTFEVLLFANMPFHMIERIIEVRAEQDSGRAHEALEN